MERPYKACPKCGCVEREGGYGLAAGGMGAYEHCSGCGILLHMTQETEGLDKEYADQALVMVERKMKAVWGPDWTPGSEQDAQEPVIPVQKVLDDVGWRGVADAQWENLEKVIPLLHLVTAPPVIANSTRTKIVAACTREDGTIDTKRLIDLTAEVARNPWKHEIEQMCIVAYIPFDEADPFKTISGLIDWHEKVALDPSVSKEAQKLKHDGFEEGADAMYKGIQDIVMNCASAWEEGHTARAAYESQVRERERNEDGSGLAPPIPVPQNPYHQKDRNTAPVPDVKNPHAGHTFDEQDDDLPF